MTNQTRYGLTEDIIAKIIGVFQRYHNIDQAILYGSRAKGNFKRGSDIDLMLVGPNLTYDELLKIANAIDDLMTPYQVDLSIEHHITNPELLEHIQKWGQIFYRNLRPTLT